MAEGIASAWAGDQEEATLPANESQLQDCNAIYQLNFCIKCLLYRCAFWFLYMGRWKLNYSWCMVSVCFNFAPHIEI